jgi:hypothetical protein
VVRDHDDSAVSRSRRPGARVKMTSASSEWASSSHFRTSLSSTLGDVGEVLEVNVRAAGRLDEAAVRRWAMSAAMFSR